MLEVDLLVARQPLRGERYFVALSTESLEFCDHRVRGASIDIILGYTVDVDICRYRNKARHNSESNKFNFGLSISVWE